ncbi:hypothetical protein [Halomonas dongshanensis]|uniref:Peptidase C-terminal archaeal/bacterial domain-containing protein n=1 Tax=Halomonas dongshanensis TaxID=2890835 RepID=A0ABT2EAM8_9GAMM|nr:hypothetical protein [Halomonas dongshanensis]MCS2608574.1 hypothetical protein [Halomonas dongshanensis]
MAKSSALSLVLVAAGGVVVGFLGAQALQSQGPNTTNDTADGSVLAGLDTLTLGERTQGEITSASEFSGSDGSRFERFALSLEEGDLIEVALSGSLNGRVALFDDQLTLLNAAETVRYRTDAAGDYMVVVSGADAQSFGPFQVLSRTIELSDSDILEVGTPLDSWLQGQSKAYTLTIEEAGLYQIDMRSDELDAYLEVSGNGVDARDDDSGEGYDARVRSYLEPGEYQVNATTSYGESNGIYTISAEPYELPNGAELQNSGTLTTGDEITGWYSGSSLSYDVEIDEAGLYQIDMISSDVDAYLELEGPNGYYREDDDGGDQLNARISDFLEPGTYQVTARTAYNDGSGLFTLGVENRELPGDGELNNSGTLTPGESFNGWYSGQDLSYELNIEETGLYQIDMTSDDVDAYLVVEGPNGYYREDDDGGDGYDARVADFLEPGTYQVTARTAFGTGSGLFTLSAESRELEGDQELQNGGAVDIGETISGWYTGEVLNYDLEITETSEVTIDMRSRDFDAYLEFAGEGMNESNDDGGNGTDARLVLTLAPGNYTIGARGFSSQGNGLFTLDVAAEPTEAQPQL